MRRASGSSWQITGAAALTVWVLAACGLETGSTVAAAHASGHATEVQRAPAPTAETPVTQISERRRVATIETGEITNIERIVVTPPSRTAEGLIVYRVVVRLQNGGSREFTEPSLGELKVGDRVQVVNGSEPTT